MILTPDSSHTLLSPPLPFCTNIELTSICNQKCIMCPLTARNTRSSEHPGHMQPAIWRRALQAAKLIGQVQWIGYGETLLHPRALDYFRELDDAGLLSSLSTNGTRLTEETCVELGSLERLIHINVSLDSLSRDVYHHIRKTPVDDAISGLKTLLKHYNPRQVTVCAVLMKENIATLGEFPPFLASLGLHKLAINVLHEGKGRHHRGSLTGGSGQFKQLVDDAKDSCLRHGIEFVVDVADRLTLEVEDPMTYEQRYGGVATAPTVRRCLLPWEFPFIDKDGNVFSCSNATGPSDEIMGSLMEEDFPAIWSNARFRRLRSAFLTAGELPTACKTCTIQQFGVHPLHEYRGRILPPTLTQALASRLFAIITVEVENLGSMTWEPGTVRIGTVRPRDRPSALATAGWLSPNRICANTVAVSPGARARFQMPIALHGEPPQQEAFQLVVDGKAWIPNTEFLVSVDAATARVHQVVERANQQARAVAHVAETALRAWSKRLTMRRYTE